MLFQTDLRVLGLTEDEANLLIGAANDAMATVRTHITPHQMRDAEYADKALTEKVNGGVIEAAEKAELFSAFMLHNRDWGNFSPRTLDERVVPGGDSFVEHPSFGSIDRSMFTTNAPRVFGSPNTSRSMTGLRFHRGIVEVSDKMLSAREPYLREGMTLLELHLSLDQFSGLLRDRHSNSPCALEHWNYRYLDVPPRMLSTFDSVEGVEKRSMAVCKPVIDAIRSMGVYLSEKAKISTQADYAELQVLARAIQDALIQAREPMQQVLKDAAGTSAEAATRQLIANIAEPLKALGMDADSLLLQLK
jgi:hypothetical protein